MRRLHRAGIVVLIATGAVWACGDDYEEAPPVVDRDSGKPDAFRDTGSVLEASVPQPSIMLGTAAPIPRGESGTVSVSIVRGAHPGTLTLAATGLPAGVSATSVTIEPDSSSATIRFSVENKAAEGGVSIDVALLDGNEKIATASTVLQVAPLRSGTLDPDFGTNGFVDLDVPQTLVAFAGDGSLYVDATKPTGLARWSKDGVRDATYGPLTKLASHTFFSMTVTDNGQVYFSGYEQGAGTSSPIVVRTATDGKTYDGTFGASGAALVKSVTSSKYATAIAVSVLPTSIYAVVKQEDDNAGNPGPFTIARMTANGLPDNVFGAPQTPGYRPLPSSAAAEGIAFIEPIGVDHYLLATPHLSTDGTAYFLHEGASGGLVLRALDPGTPTAIAFHSSGSFVTRERDGGSGIVRIGDAGVDPAFGGMTGIDAGARIRTLSVDESGRPLATGCRNGSSVWTRYLPDGGADPTYRAGGTSELTCILAMKTTDKYVYIAGTGGPLDRLRMARLLR